MTTTKLQQRTATYAPPRTGLARPGEEMRDRIRSFLHAPFGRLLEEPFAMDFLAQPVGLTPAVEVAENAKEFTVMAELPGMKQKDVHVEFEDGVLTIRGEKQEERKEEDKRYLLWERRYGSFQRSFTFPADVEPDKVAAEFDDGVLTVRLPKSSNGKSHRREIAIGGKR